MEKIKKHFVLLLAVGALIFASLAALAGSRIYTLSKRVSALEEISSVKQEDGSIITLRTIVDFLIQVQSQQKSQ